MTAWTVRPMARGGYIDNSRTTTITAPSKIAAAIAAQRHFEDLGSVYRAGRDVMVVITAD